MPYITPFITAIDSNFLSKSNTGLGNVLFQVASVYGISKMLGVPCTFPRLKVYIEKLKRLFDYNHGDTIFRNFKTLYNSESSFKIITEKQGSNKIVDNNLITQILNSKENICIYGYLESINYFIDISSEIQELFSCDDKTREYIMGKYSEVFNSGRDIVSVHFRTDYENTWYTNDMDYYRKALKYMCDNLNNPLFLIFSDCLDKVNYDIFGDLDIVKIKEPIDYIEMYIMSFCHHNIINVSTFGWWGAFLNKNTNKIVLYDKRLTFESLNIFTGL